MASLFPHLKLLITLSVLLFQVHRVISVTLKWSKDTQPTFHKENDGSLTAIYNIMEGAYTDIESHRRRLSDLPQSQLRTLLLDTHNQLRAKTANGFAPCRCGTSCGRGHQGAGYHPGATNMNALFWDSALERVAQQYSARCLFVHNTQSTSETLQYSYLASWSQSKEKYIGENLYISSTGQKVWNNIYGTTDYGIEGGLQQWWNECIDYQLIEGGSCGDDIGHYTQYIRADARFVGCGVSICPYGVDTRTGRETWANMNLVCNYAGGQYGDRPYDIAESAQQVASNCEPDRIPHFGLHGLCGGPQARDWFENPKQHYDKTSFPTTNWICDDGTGRDMCSGAQSGTPKPTLHPFISTTTAKPTNNPITPQPTSNPVFPTLRPSRAPSKLITPQPTQHIVTPMPTEPTQPPTTLPPTKVFTKQPTPSPLVPTTQRPTTSPVDDTADCEPSDCTFTTHIMWRSERKRYKGFVDAVWSTERELLGLESEETWGGKWSDSWGGQYRRSESTGGWVLYIWDNIEIEWEQMLCHKRDYYSTYMQSSDFEEQMKSGIGELMGSKTGQVTEVTVSVSCNHTSNEAFGMIEADGKVEIPFSALNLNTYDFRDWFFLSFCLFVALFVCFMCGYRMHRRRVLNALEYGTYDEYEKQEMDTLEDEDGYARTHNALGTYNIKGTREDSMEDIQIGVSMDTTQGNILVSNEWD